VIKLNEGGEDKKSKTPHIFDTAIEFQQTVLTML
jgi:hypothetical protein